MAVYDDVVAEVRAELSLRVEAAVQAGVRPEQIVIDPGIGFAKRATQSRAVLQGLPDLTSLGYPVLVGISRKSIIGAVAEEPETGRRLGGSLAAGLFAVLRGASILRVHDVGRQFRHFVSGIHCSNKARFRFPNAGAPLDVPHGATDSA